jgi:DNA-binding HxlR family transcriptional regulator
MSEVKMRKNAEINATPVCQVRMQAISDAMSLLSGKWKFHILGTLIEGNKLGFMDLLREIDGIGTKMLSKELQDLEMNNLVSRTVMNTKPITVEYSITEYGKTLSSLIDELANWGIEYRRSVYEKGKN